MSVLVVISGPSGVGKGTILTSVLRAYPQLELGLSWTTRPPRPGDAEGTKKYRFVTREEFEAAIVRGEFLEWAEFGEHLYGSWYGGDHHTLLEIEVQGAQQVAQSRPDALLVGVVPPGRNLEEQLSTVEARLRARKTDEESVIARRLETAPYEIETIRRLWPHIIVNDSLGRACTELIELLAPRLEGV